MDQVLNGEVLLGTPEGESKYWGYRGTHFEFAALLRSRRDNEGKYDEVFNPEDRDWQPDMHGLVAGFERGDPDGVSLDASKAGRLAVGLVVNPRGTSL